MALTSILSIFFSAMSLLLKTNYIISVFLKKKRRHDVYYIIYIYCNNVITITYKYIIIIFDINDDNDNNIYYNVINCISKIIFLLVWYLNVYIKEFFLQ